MQRIGVLTSGGDAPGMNAAVRAVTRKAVACGLKVTGIMRGYAGLIHGEFRELESFTVSDIVHRGGTILRTARCPEFFTPEGREKGLNQAKKAGIDGLIIIGGDGTFRGAVELAALGLPTVGIPATIDNDIPGTDYTLGFETAVNTAVEAITKIRDTATSHERVFIVEVMGRNTGFLALAAGIAGGAESILIPEYPFDLEAVIAKINQSYARGKLHSIIVVAEGVGSAVEIGQKIRERTRQETRVTILGHVQRGGSPTAFDALLASRLGAEAIDLLLAGEKDQLVGFQKGKTVHFPLESIFREKRAIDHSLYALAEVLAQ